MTQANEHLTPKPLDQHVPGEWNFIEPIREQDGAERLAAITTMAATYVRPRLTLSPEQREKLLEAMGWDPDWMAATLDEPDSKGWRQVEDALMELFAPPRYITGVAQPAPWLSDPHAP